MKSDDDAQQALDALLSAYQRVVYDNNPLIEVILQIRFPTYLRLLTEVPSVFQGEILSEYPHYETKDTIELKASGPNAPPTLSESKVHIFLSNDRNWRIALGSDSLSMSCREYKHWEDFKKRADFCIETFFKTYPIKVITRVGLRYRDLINRRKIQKENASWSELINPLVLGPMGAPEFSDFELETAKWAQMFSVGELKFNLQGGTAKQGDDRCYALDLDISIVKETIVDDSLDSQIERLHRPVGPLFKWAITNDLHSSLGPQPASNGRGAQRRGRSTGRK